MEITLKLQIFADANNDYIIIEQYAKKPNFCKFYRYFINGAKISDYLLTKPNAKRLCENYLTNAKLVKNYKNEKYCK